MVRQCLYIPPESLVPLYAFFAHLTLVKSSLFIHSGLLSPVFDFLLVGIGLLSLEEMIFKIQTALLDRSSLQGHIPWDSSKQIPEQAKVFSPNIQDHDPAFCPALS